MGKCGGEPRPPRRIDLVELQGGDRRQLSDKQSVSGAGLEHDIRRSCSREQDGHGCDVDRCRELLPVDLFLAAHRLRRQAIEQAEGEWEVGRGLERLRTAHQMERQRMLEHLEALALRPAPLCVRTTEGVNHRLVEVASAELRLSAE